MDVVEKAIRNAFEKGDPEDRAFREKVYRSAFAALDRALTGNPSVTVEAAITRRKALQAKITEIESEFLPAAPPPPRVEPAPRQSTPALAPELSSEPRLTEPVAFAAPPVSVEPAAGGGRTAAAAPDLVAERASSGAPSIEVAQHDDFAEPLPGDLPDSPARAAERRRPFAATFIAATLLAAAGIGLWWAFQTGLLKSPAERDTSVPNPPVTTEAEDFSPEAEAPPGLPGQPDAERNWVTVFSPADPTAVNAPAGASAEVMEDDSGAFMRVRSGPEGAAVLVDIGQGVLESIAGKQAMFDIVARAEEGKETEMAVDCNFGELGDCGRKRYSVGHDRGDYLFEMQLPAVQPGAGGTIAINSDFSDGGKAVDIYEIRMSVAE